MNLKSLFIFWIQSTGETLKKTLKSFWWTDETLKCLTNFSVGCAFLSPLYGIQVAKAPCCGKSCCCLVLLLKNSQCPSRCGVWVCVLVSGKMKTWVVLYSSPLHLRDLKGLQMDVPPSLSVSAGECYVIICPFPDAWSTDVILYL